MAEKGEATPKDEWQKEEVIPLKKEDVWRVTTDEGEEIELVALQVEFDDKGIAHLKKPAEVPPRVPPEPKARQLSRSSSSATTMELGASDRASADDEFKADFELKGEGDSKGERDEKENSAKGNWGEKGNSKGKWDENSGTRGIPPRASGTSGAASPSRGRGNSNDERGPAKRVRT